MSDGIRQLVDFFRGQKVLILGFGREGQSTYHFLRRYLPEQTLYLADADTALLEKHPELRADQNLTCALGDHYLARLADFDIIMKSPGISFKELNVNEFENKIQSQLELMLRFFRVPTIGVTGTKGKSTTSSLIFQILQDQKVPSLLLGNIGEPVFEYLQDLRDDTTVVLEMSSHQLEFMHHSPHIAVLTNLYEEHLDHYRSFTHYALAKCNIFRFQTTNDYFLYDADEELLVKIVTELQPVAQSLPLRLADVNKMYDVNAPRQLLGDYNLLNIAFALQVAQILGLDLGKATASVNHFQPLPHRLELVGEVGGVKYYDNSIGTIPEATIAAVAALGDVDTLIIGGMDRGLDYSDFIRFLNQSEIQHVICMPKTGHDIAPQLTPEKVCQVETLEEAVAQAKKLTAPGKSCLLSPAAASYGFFKNFEEKGKLFKELVLKY